MKLKLYFSFITVAKILFFFKAKIKLKQINFDLNKERNSFNLLH